VHGPHSTDNIRYLPGIHLHEPHVHHLWNALPLVDRWCTSLAAQGKSDPARRLGNPIIIAHSTGAFQTNYLVLLPQLDAFAVWRYVCSIVLCCGGGVGLARDRSRCCCPRTGCAAQCCTYGERWRLLRTRSHELGRFQTDLMFSILPIGPFVGCLKLKSLNQCVLVFPSSCTGVYER
jgi:hypothetical protein